MFEWYLLSLLAAFIWAWIEMKSSEASKGIVSMLLGCSIFCFTLINIPPYDTFSSGVSLTLSLFIALLGTGRFIVAKIKADSPNVGDGQGSNKAQ